MRRKTMSDALIQIDGSYQNVAANGDEKNWDADSNRWTKGDNDRLYFNDCKFVDYVALDSLIVITNGSGVDATAEIDGDELTVEITREDVGCHKEWTATFALPDDLVEETDDDQDDVEDDEPEIVTDGGEDVTDDLSDEDIQDAIDQNDSSATVAEIRDLLAQVNSDALEWWDEYQDGIDDGAHEIIADSADTVVLVDPSGHLWSNQFHALERDGEIEPNTRNVIKQLHHTLADQHVDRSWSTAPPVVVAKPTEFRAGEKHLLRKIARRTAEEGSVARGVDRLATEEYGWAKSNWATLSGRNPSSVTRTTSDK